MKKQVSSGGQGGGAPSGPEKTKSRRSPTRALVVSSALVVICFIAHIFVLVLIDPAKAQNFSKLNAYALASIPLGMGLVFLLDAINNFRRIETRSPAHLVPLLLAIVFGGLGIQGLLGFMIYFIRHSFLM